MQEKRNFNNSIWELGTLGASNLAAIGNMSVPSSDISTEDPSNDWDSYRLAAVYSTNFATGPGCRLFYHSQDLNGTTWVQEMIWIQSSDSWTHGASIIGPWPNSDLAATVDESTQILRLFYSAGNLTLQESWLNMSDPRAEYQIGTTTLILLFSNFIILTTPQASDSMIFLLTTTPILQQFLLAATLLSITTKRALASANSTSQESPTAKETQKPLASATPSSLSLICSQTTTYLSINPLLLPSPIQQALQPPSTSFGPTRTRPRLQDTQSCWKSAVKKSTRHGRRLAAQRELDWSSCRWVTITSTLMIEMTAIYIDDFHNKLNTYIKYPIHDYCPISSMLQVITDCEFSLSPAVSTPSITPSAYKSIKQRETHFLQRHEDRHSQTLQELNRAKTQTSFPAFQPFVWRMYRDL